MPNFTCNCEDRPCCGCHLENPDPNEQFDPNDPDNFPDDDDWDDEPHDMTDVEADADTLRSCGWGMDEEYGGGMDDGWGDSWGDD